MNQYPKVSVCMITYGHEKFIEQAINGVLMQECDFEVELIIANDCSQDLTDNVIQNILANHPKASWIKYLKHDKNLGMMPNFIFAMQECKSEYIALCEGDDYWTDPQKLQKQVDFLEQNPEYVIHSGCAQILYDKKGFSESILGITSDEREFTVNDFYTQNKLITCTVMFRNILCEYPNSFFTITFGDWFLYIVLLQKSKSKAFVSDAVFAVYRIHEAGIMKTLSEIEKIDAHFQQIETIKEYIGYEKKSLKDIKNINAYFRNKLIFFLKKNLYARGFKSFLLNIEYCGFQTNLTFYIKLPLKHLIKYRIKCNCIYK